MALEIIPNGARHKPSSNMLSMHQRLVVVNLNFHKYSIIYSILGAGVMVGSGGELQSGVILQAGYPVTNINR